MPNKRSPADQANEPVLSAQDILDIQAALVERDSNTLDRFSDAMLRTYINNPENNYARVNEALQSDLATDY